MRMEMLQTGTAGQTCKSEDVTVCIQHNTTYHTAYARYVKMLMPQTQGHSMDEPIRQAGPQDAEALATIICQSFSDVAVRFGLTPANCPTHPSSCTPAWVHSDLAKGKQYFLLEINSQPAGCISVACPRPPTGEIGRLAVLPQLRHCGYGDRLLNHALQTLHDQGMSRAELAIIADHTDLQAWYERRGFTVTATKHFPHLPFAVTFMAATA